MYIDFIIDLEDDYTLKVYDITLPSQDLPLNIYSMTLDIISSKIPNGQIANKLDVIAYLANQREQKELYTITSQILGFSTSQIIPDGVYHFYYTINNGISKENTFLVCNTVEKAVNELIQNVNYQVTIGDYNVSYVGDSSTYDIEQVRLAVALWDELRSYSQEPDEVNVNDTLDKLTRLLTIINTNI